MLMKIDFTLKLSLTAQTKFKIQFNLSNLIKYINYIQINIIDEKTCQWHCSNLQWTCYFV